MSIPPAHWVYPPPISVQTGREQHSRAVGTSQQGKSHPGVDFVFFQ